MSKAQQSYPVQIEQLLLQGGRVLDPQVNLDKVTDVHIMNGKIKKIGKVDAKSFKGQIVDCQDKLIIPGLVDMHVHLREPGREDKETIETGCRAAMAGGFTAVCCMPNTQPPIDSRSHVEFIKERSEGFLVDVHPIAAVTKGLQGEELTEMGDMTDGGAVGFSDDGWPVKQASLLRRALEYAKMFGHPIIDHCEELSLSEDGVMHEGFVSTGLGMKGIPSISEEITVARDLLVAEYTGGPLHIAHVSTKGSVRLIREAKKRGVSVTAETCPHYLVLTDEAVRSFNTNMKMKPPLRTDEDQQALIEALQDGTIDVIASDHAPHAIEEKETEYNTAAFGIIGLETTLGIVMTHLIAKGLITLEEMIQKMAVNPRKILRLAECSIQVNASANLTVLDPNIDWTIDKTTFYSKSRNTPFDGWPMKGGCLGVLNKGQLFLNC
ncbi:dihydroorotase [bacterium]|nr:dihydroorotase [bacterium]